MTDRTSSLTDEPTGGRPRRLLAVSHAMVRGINRAIYRDIADAGWDVQMISAETLQLPGQTIACEAPRQGDPPLHVLPITTNSPRQLKFRGLNKLIDDLTPDVVHLEIDPISLLATETGNHARSLGPSRPMVTCMSCENLSLRLPAIARREGLRGVVTGIAKRWLARSARRVVDHVFTISNDGTAVFQDLGFESVSKIPLGFDPAYFCIRENDRDEIRQSHNLNVPVVAYFGRFVPEKGIDLLIKALGQLRDQPWVFMLDQFEGDDEYTQLLKDEIQRQGISDRIVEIHAAHGEVARYMNAADVVVLPSISTSKWVEQYGRVAPEAMACGRCVIVADTGALPELVDRYGHTFPEGDVDALVRDAISQPRNQ
ncbi:MAG: glycosyltransferase, partial [Planctomycetota bacterium]